MLTRLLVVVNAVLLTAGWLGVHLLPRRTTTPANPKAGLGAPRRPPSVGTEAGSGAVGPAPLSAFAVVAERNLLQPKPERDHA
jgi:hypothetical protein